jgi:hypothetical protein
MGIHADTQATLQQDIATLPGAHSGWFCEKARLSFSSLTQKGDPKITLLAHILFLWKDRL